MEIDTEKDRGGGKGSGSGATTHCQRGRHEGAADGGGVMVKRLVTDNDMFLTCAKLVLDFPTWSI